MKAAKSLPCRYCGDEVKLKADRLAALVEADSLPLCPSCWKHQESLPQDLLDTLFADITAGEDLSQLKPEHVTQCRDELPEGVQGADVLPCPPLPEDPDTEQAASAARSPFDDPCLSSLDGEIACRPGYHLEVYHGEDFQLLDGSILHDGDEMEVEDGVVFDEYLMLHRELRELREREARLEQQHEQGTQELRALRKHHQNLLQKVREVLKERQGLLREMFGGGGPRRPPRKES